MADRCRKCDRPDCPTLTTEPATMAAWKARNDTFDSWDAWRATVPAAAKARTDCRAHTVDWRKRAMDAELTIEVDQQRLADAGMRVGQCYGCDTPDAMADEIEALRDTIAQVRAHEFTAKHDTPCLAHVHGGKYCDCGATRWQEGYDAALEAVAGILGEVSHGS